jgi:hypothetical protein
MAKCRHPNIVSLVDAFLWNNTIWVRSFSSLQPR